MKINKDWSWVDLADILEEAAEIMLVAAENMENCAHRLPWYGGGGDLDRSALQIRQFLKKVNHE